MDMPQKNSGEIIKELAESLTARIILDNFKECETLEEYQQTLKKLCIKYEVEE